MHLSMNDYNVLKNYKFVENNDLLSAGSSTHNNEKYQGGIDYLPFNTKNNLQLLAIESDGTTPAQLCTIQTKDITIFNLFLSIFNKGKLKHKIFSIKKICDHLSQFDFSNLKNSAVDTDNDRVFANVSALAYKNWFYKYDTSLLSKVADQFKFEGSCYVHYENKHLKARDFRVMKMRDISWMTPDRPCFDYFRMCAKNSDGTLSTLPNNALIKNEDGSYKYIFDYAFAQQKPYRL